MKLKKLCAAVLALCLCLALFAGSASATETYAISHVNCQSYPNSTNGNTLPFVGQNYSDFYCATTTAGVVVTGWSLIDGNGNACSGKVENRSYTLNIYVSSQAVNYLFNAGTGASINNESASITVAADGLSATISRSIYPLFIAPTIYHHPTDESHNAGETFSYTASASKLYDSFQWYVCSPSGMQVTKAEEIRNVSPTAEAVITDAGDYVRCNLHNVDAGLDGWQVYCTFISTAGQTSTNKASIIVKNAAEVLATPEPTPEIVVTPTPQIIETPAPEIVTTPEPEIEVVTEAWEDAWSTDEDSHWHASALPENTDTADVGSHTYTWTETAPATWTEEGEETGTCTVCGYQTTRAPEKTDPLTGTTFGIPNLAFFAAGGLGILMLLAAASIGIGNAIAGAKARRRRRNG